MKMNNLLENTKVDPGLMNSFMLSQRGTKFDFGEDDILNQLNEYATISIDQDLINRLNLTDYDGILKIKFGFVAGDFVLRNAYSLRSLKNIPTKCNTLDIRDLSIKHFDFQNANVNNIIVSDCDNFNKISNISTDSLSTLQISGCSKIKRFKQIPILNTNTLLIMSSMDLNIIQNDNNSIHNLELLDIDTLVNFYNLPSDLKKLKIIVGINFKSFRGIETYEKLIKLQIHGVDVIHNIINVLLCENLVDTVFYLRNTTVMDIIKKYMNMSIIERSDYIMDCAVELIDAGYPEAAEL